MSKMSLNCKHVADLPSELQSEYRDFENGFVTLESYSLYVNVHDDELLKSISLREAQKMEPLDVLHCLASSMLGGASEASTDPLHYLETPLTGAVKLDGMMRSVIRRAQASCSPEDVERVRKYIQDRLAQNSRDFEESDDED